MDKTVHRVRLPFTRIGAVGGHGKSPGRHKGGHIYGVGGHSGKEARQPQRYRTERNELIKRLLADECELCVSTVDVEVHHIRALRDLNVKGQREKPKWVLVMAARKRKTLLVCRTCHLNAHDGSWNPRKQE